MGVLLSIPVAMGAAAYTVLTLPCLALSALCCCCQGISCVCSTVNVMTCCCRGAMGKRTGISPRLAKIFYIVLLGLTAILAIIMRFNATQLDLGALSVSCSGGNTSVSVDGFSQATYVYCKGDAAVYRISFILSTFFGLMVVLSLISEAAHRGFWLLKILLLVGGITGSFFMPDASFDNQGYAWAARIGSVFFLILQILVLIDFAYQWNENWVNRAYADTVSNNPDTLTNKNWLIAVLSSAALLYALSITGIALLYVFYASCEIGMAYTTVTVISIVLITLLSLFRDRIVGEPGAILPAAVVVAYIVFLCWASLESNPDGSCRPVSQQTAASIAIGATWATITLLWTTFSVTNNASHLVKGEALEKAEEVQEKEATNTKDAESQQVQQGSAIKKPKKNNKATTGGPVYREDLEAPVPDRNTATNNNGDLDDDDDSPIYSTEKPWSFHLIMLCASMYLAMLLTDWGTFSGGNASLTSGEASMWVKISAQWVTIILFVWTLIAPRMLTGRDFS